VSLHFPLLVNGQHPPRSLSPLAPPPPFTLRLLGVTLHSDTLYGRSLFRGLCRGGRGFLCGPPLSQPCLLIIAGVVDNPVLRVPPKGRDHFDGHGLLCGPLLGRSLLSLLCGPLLGESLLSFLCWGILLDDCCLRGSILLFVLLIIAAVDLFRETLLPYLLLNDTLILLKLFLCVDLRLAPVSRPVRLAISCKCAYICIYVCVYKSI